MFFQLFRNTLFVPFTTSGDASLLLRPSRQVHEQLLVRSLGIPGEMGNALAFSALLVTFPAGKPGILFEREVLS